MKWIASVVLLMGALGGIVKAETSGTLSFESKGGWFHSNLSGLLDVEGYYIDQNPPGLLASRNDYLFNPRLSLYLDTKLGSHFYSLVQARFDRGFDPGVRKNGDARLDEYLLRYIPFDDPRLNIQAGKFATVVGNWVSRHDSWNNPFINAPLPYENITIAADRSPPASPSAFLARRNRTDNKPAWLPIIWGPSYASGASVFGFIGRLDYAFEIKNAGLSSRPAVWDGAHQGWEHPTASGRIGYRPNEAWNVGISASGGPYMLEPAEQAVGFPKGTGVDDYQQLTVGQDISYAWHHWQFWGEAYASRFEVPNVGNADTLAYYIEGKYKFSARLFGALRWNQQLFDNVRDASGTFVPWDKDMWRAEAALGYRFNRHFQGKVQYGYSDQRGRIQQGEQMVAVQATVKF